VTALLWLAVGLLGGVGALGRFLLDAAVSLRARGQFPAGTLVVNTSGALLLGLLVGLGVGGQVLLLAGVATLGSYTTFSTGCWSRTASARTASWAWLRPTWR
jgi:CrcB protein